MELEAAAVDGVVAELGGVGQIGEVVMDGVVIWDEGRRSGKVAGVEREYAKSIELVHLDCMWIYSLVEVVGFLRIGPELHSVYVLRLELPELYRRGRATYCGNVSNVLDVMRGERWVYVWNRARL